MKLYNIYNIISNKTVRNNEHFYKRFKKYNKSVLGQLVQTNRGYFIDGKNVDLKAVHLWHEMNKNPQLANNYSAEWKKHQSSKVE